MNHANNATKIDYATKYTEHWMLAFSQYIIKSPSIFFQIGDSI